MSFLKNLVKKAGSVVKSVGQGIAKAKNVLLPIAGVAAGLALPGIGGIIGNAASKIGNKPSGLLSKVKEITGIGDGKPGVFGIGDGQPGFAGLGTGKAALKRLKMSAEELTELESAKVKLQSGLELTAPERIALAKAQELEDDSSGVPGWLKLAGGALAVKLLLG